jgi:heme-degrading monooxygenase HmoA
MRDFRRAPGNRGTFFLHRVDGDVAHVLTLSFWDSYDSIEALLGNDAESAGYYPEDQRFLLDFPKCVEHFVLDVAQAHSCA